MSKKYFLIVVILMLLVGCSQEIEQSQSEQHILVKDVQQSGEQDDNDIEQEITENVQEESVSEIKSTEIIEERNEDIPEFEVAENTNYYNFYTSGLEENSSDVSVFKKQDIIYEQPTAELIQLPLLEDNKDNFEENVEKITLQDLEELQAIEYIEEPLTRGYLIDLNLEILKQHYKGISYSFEYDNVEYGVIVSEDSPESGFLFIREVEGLLEDIKSTGIFNILK